MKKFHTLRQFLLLQDETNRSIHRTFYDAEDVIRRYDKAKESWNKYGDNPPFGSKVSTLQAGCGGGEGEGVLRTLAGIYPDDKRFFQLSRKDSSSIIWREFWWTAFEVVEEE